MITLWDYLTASGKYTKRENSSELTPELLENAAGLILNITKFFADIGYEKSLIVSSGFRPSDVNNGIPNAAKKSLHMSCLAIDIADPDGKLDEYIKANDKAKKRFGLWQEHPMATPGWVHLDLKDRGFRATNIFIP